MPPEARIKSFADVHVIVFLRMYFQEDSVAVRRDTTAIILQKHSRYNFSIELRPENEFEAENIPTLYFLHKGVPVLIFTGLERWIHTNEKAIAAMKKSVFSKQPVHEFFFIPENFWINVDTRYPKGYKISRLKYFDVPDTQR